MRATQYRIRFYTIYFLKTKNLFLFSFFSFFLSFYQGYTAVLHKATIETRVQSLRSDHVSHKAAIETLVQSLWSDHVSHKATIETLV